MLHLDIPSRPNSFPLTILLYEQVPFLLIFPCGWGSTECLHWEVANLLPLYHNNLYLFDSLSQSCLWSSNSTSLETGEQMEKINCLDCLQFVPVSLQLHPQIYLEYPSWFVAYPKPRLLFQLMVSAFLALFSCASSSSSSISFLLFSFLPFYAWFSLLLPFFPSFCLDEAGWKITLPFNLNNTSQLRQAPCFLTMLHLCSKSFY